MSNPHTARQLAPAIGSTVTVRFEQLQIRCSQHSHRFPQHSHRFPNVPTIDLPSYSWVTICLVLDAKNAYGQVRLLVMPVAGEGEQWVDLSRLVGPEVVCTAS